MEFLESEESAGSDYFLRSNDPIEPNESTRFTFNGSVGFKKDVGFNVFVGSNKFDECTGPISHKCRKIFFTGLKNCNMRLK